MLNAHPDVCCQGEGLFLNHLAVPLERAFADRGKVIAGKNETLFGHTGGYPLPVPADTEFLLATAILAAMRRQLDAPSMQGRKVQLVGEKTPENAFFFPRLRRMFPQAKFIGIARDPRDVLASAWHYFVKTHPDQDQDAAKTQFVERALPSMNDGAKAMVGFARGCPEDALLITYEQLLAHPAAVMTRLYGLLGVSAPPALVAQVVDMMRFDKQTGGRPAGVEARGAFLRQGVAGGWPATFSPALARKIVDATGWMFPVFGWTP